MGDGQQKSKTGAGRVVELGWVFGVGVGPRCRHLVGGQPSMSRDEGWQRAEHAGKSSCESQMGQHDKECGPGIERSKWARRHAFHSLVLSPSAGPEFSS